MDNTMKKISMFKELAEEITRNNSFDNLMQQIKTYPTLGEASSRTIDSGAQTEEGSGVEMRQGNNMLQVR